MLPRTKVGRLRLRALKAPKMHQRVTWTLKVSNRVAESKKRRRQRKVSLRKQRTKKTAKKKRKSPKRLKLLIFMVLARFCVPLGLLVATCISS